MNTMGAARGRQSLLYQTEQQNHPTEESPYRASSDMTQSAQSHSGYYYFRGFEPRAVRANMVGAGRASQSPSHRDEQQTQLIGDSPYSASFSFAESGKSQTSSKGPVRNKIRKRAVKEGRDGVAVEDKANSTTSFLLDWWKELAVILTSVAFLAAVYIVLLSVHDTRLEDWSMPFGVQPTALIATLITLCKLFLLVVVAEALSQLKWVYFEQQPHKLEDIEHFDSASRGAFGAILFLSKVRWRAVAASVGAVVTYLH